MKCAAEAVEAGCRSLMEAELTWLVLVALEWCRPYPHSLPCFEWK